jgi:hypothetical protein
MRQKKRFKAPEQARAEEMCGMNLANLKIEELEKRIMAGGEDAVACVYAAERLIRGYFTQVGGPDNTVECLKAASATFILWRQGKLGICTMPHGHIGFYRPHLQ